MSLSDASHAMLFEVWRYAHGLGPEEKGDFLWHLGKLGSGAPPQPGAPPWCDPILNAYRDPHVTCVMAGRCDCRCATCQRAKSGAKGGPKGVT